MVKHDSVWECVRGAGSVQPMDTDAGSAAAVPSQAAAASHALERADRSSSSSSAPPANSTQQHTAVTSSSSGVSSYSSGNPYMSKQMYSSSFMSTEGSQSIQSLIGGHTRDELDKSSLASHILQQVRRGFSSLLTADCVDYWLHWCFTCLGTGCWFHVVNVTLRNSMGAV